MKLKNLLFTLLVLVMLLAIAPGEALDNATIEKAKTSAVRVYVEAVVDPDYIQFSDSNGRTFRIPEEYQTCMWIGSAFAVGKPGEAVEYFVTNHHVANEEGEFTAFLYDAEAQAYVKNEQDKFITADFDLPAKVDYYLIFESKDNKVPVSRVCVSDRADLAVLRLNQPTTQRQAAVLRPFKSISNEAVFAAGFPSVGDWTQTDIVSSHLLSTLKDMTVTDGRISKLLDHSQTQEGQLLHMSVPVNGGNSGGPLFDEKGYVVGVNTFVYATAQATNGAVSVNEVIRMLDNEEIPYTTDKQDMLRRALPYIIALVIIAVAAVVVVVLRRRGAPTGKGGKEFKKTKTRTLAVERGALAGKSYPLPLSVTVTIGTDASAARIVLPEGTPGISRRHCTVTNKDGVVTVTDYSSYGTWIDNVRLTKGQPTVMHRGHRLYLGSQKESMILRS